jgi:membrane associated rhomboid family serine protease
MRQPPSPKEFSRFPVTGVTALLALGVTLTWWATKLDVSPLLEDVHIRQGQVWRLLTCTLVHLDPLHLAFDVYWTWVFGSLIEETLGHLATLLIFVLLAIGSGAAEYAVFVGGAGLSGIGYGLFGMLWVLTYRDRRFRNGIDNQTAVMFVAWFFLCIVLTYVGKPIGNVAHGMGFVLGALLGWAVAGPRPQRILGAAAVAVLLSASLLGAIVFRSWVNFSHDGSGEAQVGYAALNEHRDRQALGWYHDAIRIEPANGIFWYNLGIASGRLGDLREAKSDFHHAVELDPANKEYLSAEQGVSAVSN